MTPGCGECADLMSQGKCLFMSSGGAVIGFANLLSLSGGSRGWSRVQLGSGIICCEVFSGVGVLSASTQRIWRLCVVFGSFVMPVWSITDLPRCPFEAGRILREAVAGDLEVGR